MKYIAFVVFISAFAISGGASAQGVGRYAKGPSASDLATPDTLMRWCRRAVIDKYGYAKDPHRPNVKSLSRKTAIGSYSMCSNSQGKSF